MRSLFYPKLAVTNIQKNGKVYVPYLITGALTVAMYYIILSIVYNEGIKQMPGAGDVVMLLGTGIGVVSIFAAIFLFYTNSFLIKRRKKELGLYNVLGMGKGHLAKMMLCETLLIAFIDLAGGLILGVVFSKLMFLLLLKITRLTVPLKFMVEPKAMLGTLTLFGCIFAVTLLYNMWQVFRVNTVELLHGGDIGEREPKTKVLLTIIGAVTLGSGYYLAITTKSPLEAFFVFFVAVVLVIIGTYALFTAGSIAVLKLLRKNKNYYYKTNHFISISGMIYRMKQNAVGLANVCILSTMVLVMISSTASMYAGLKGVLANRYPYEFEATTNDAAPEDMERFHQDVREKAKELGVTIKTEVVYQGMDFYVNVDGKNKLSIITSNSIYPGNGMVVTFIPVSYYNQIQNTKEELEEGEVLLCLSKRSKTLDITEGTLQLGQSTFQVKNIVTDFINTGKANMNVMDTMYIVVPDLSAAQSLCTAENEAADTSVTGSIGFDFKGSEKKIRELTDYMDQQFQAYTFNGYAEIRSELREGLYAFYGGFLFLGLFLGILFLMATVLIIYYKQISEGYDDQTRFQIMQKVGMSKKEVRKSIKSQVLSVFFLPLVVAVLHICVAFPVITRLLAVMNLTDVGMFRNCTILTIGVFAVIYGIVYGITAREYYKIVN